MGDTHLTEAGKELCATSPENTETPRERNLWSCSCFRSTPGASFDFGRRHQARGGVQANRMSIFSIREPELREKKLKVSKSHSVLKLAPASCTLEVSTERAGKHPETYPALPAWPRPRTHMSASSVGEPPLGLVLAAPTDP